MNYEETYSAVHSWLKNKFGPAKKCEHCRAVKAVRYEYALIKGERYEKKRGNFIELCSKCHKKYDGIIEKLTKNKYKPVVALLGESRFEFPSIQEAVRATAVSKTSISNCLSGRSLSAGGYKWIYA